MWNTLDVDIWQMLERDLKDFSFPYAKYNASVLGDLNFGNDMANFRVGPARLFQFRQTCGNFKPKWKKTNSESVTKVDLESPLFSPWLESAAAIPGDWESDSEFLRKFPKCGFEANVGSSSESSDIILNFLFENAWIDNETELLFFEQTFLNANLNSLFQVQLSFEKVIFKCNNYYSWLINFYNSF